MRADSGPFDDVNPALGGQAHYDADVDEEDRGVESDGEGYISDCSSQDTVRERSTQQNSGMVGLQSVPNCYKTCAFSDNCQ